MVKDLTQEIFIRAYLNYDYYTEDNRIQAWLAVIARNKLKDYYKSEKYQNSYIAFSPLDESTDTMPESPEAIVMQKDFTDRIIAIINTLPPKQRDVIMYSYFYDYSENEIAKMQNISVGTVKSAKHYGLEKVKKLITENNLIIGKANNMNKLNKQEAYSLLYQYAKNQISNEDKTAIEEYIKTDEEAANIASALKQLYPKLTYARDDETTHYNISIPLNNGDRILFSNISYHMENYKEMNEYLEKYGGHTPPDGHWFESGSSLNPANAVFDNEGNRLEMNIWYPPEENKNHHRANVKRMKKIFYPVHWICMVYYTTGKTAEFLGYYDKVKEAPNLYKAITMNYFGNNTTVKSALYLTLPEKSGNIRMIRGNGVIDCGKYKFIYADRYVMGEEGIFAECTFNM